jgi:hypothetical protein
MSHELKVCTGCHIEKSTTEFYGDQWSADGLKSRCKPCLRARDQEKCRVLPDELSGPRPECFTPEQWATHVRLETKLCGGERHAPDPSGFCASCTPEYRDKMHSVGKCRHPDVVFTEDDDGEVTGHRLQVLRWL